MKFQVRVEGAEKTSAEFKDARRDINGRLKKGLQTAGDRVALPEAKRLAPYKTGRLKNSLVVRATSRRAVLTTNLRGKKGRYVGLIEWGGTVKTPIRPRSKKALKIGSRFVANVTAPRVYKGKHFLTDAVKNRRAAIDLAIETEVMKAFDGLEHKP